MALFKYHGRTTRGDAVDGSLESESAEALASHLFARGITPTEIKPVVPSQDVAQDLWRRLGGGQPTITDLILFSRQMYSITKAGLPLLRGLQSIAASTPNAVLRETLGSVIENLQGGRELSFGFSRFPDVFSKFYVSVIKVGESSGTLETAFLRMYEYLGMEKRIRDKVKAALRYPATVIVAIAIAIIDHHGLGAAEVRADLRGARRQPAVGHARADRHVELRLASTGTSSLRRCSPRSSASGSSSATRRAAIAGTSSSSTCRSSAASRGVRRSRRFAARSR